MFGRALRRSAWELLGVAVTSLLVLLAFSHAGHLVRHFLDFQTQTASPDHPELNNVRSPLWSS